MSQNNYLSKREVYPIIKIKIWMTKSSQNNYLSKREVYLTQNVSFEVAELVSK